MFFNGVGVPSLACVTVVEKNVGEKCWFYLLSFFEN